MKERTCLQFFDHITLFLLSLYTMYNIHYISYSDFSHNDKTLFFVKGSMTNKDVQSDENMLDELIRA